jgi:predicted permease
MRAYRALLHLFPASFRREYGDEMASLFGQRLREAPGPVARAGLWVEAAFDTVASAVPVHVDLLRQDLRYSGRTMRRSPGFAVTAVLVAALGVGATTASFSIADHVLVRPLPFPAADRVVRLWQDQAFRGYAYFELSPANYRDWKRASTSFETMGGFRFLSANLVGDGEPERLDGASFTADVLRVLQVQPALGRAFTDEDDREGAPGTLLLSDGLWRARFGAERDVVGRTVLLDDQPHVVIGVMPPGFHFPTRDAEIWTAMRFAERDFEDRNDTYIHGVARLRPGIGLAQAHAELDVIAARLAREYPELTGTGANVVGLRDAVSERSRLLLLALLGASVCVLLIACANLAGLLLARALARRHELAVRTAMGAGRERLIRQLFTESVLLSLAGGVLGVALATAATPLAAQLVPTTLPIAESPGPDWRLLGIALLLTVATAVGFGVLPALRVSRDVDPAGLREGSRGAVGGHKERLRRALVVCEIAVCVVLLVSAGLLIRALWRVQQVDPGFRAEGVLTLRTVLPRPRYENVATRERFYASVLDEVRGLPGVSGAAYVSFLPMVMRGGIWSVTLDGQPEDPATTRMVSLRFVTPGFFEALGIPLVAGRDVDERDRGDKPFVAVVSESFVRQYWPGVNPLGRRVRVAFQDREVVGVVGDVRVRGLERESEPQVYLPSPQVPDGGLINYAPKDLAIRASADAGALLPALRRIVARADPQQPISDVRWLSEIVDADTAPRAVQVRVLAAFAAVAALLAGVGIHGLLAFTVSSRAGEIGVRLALGAGKRDIVGLVLREGVLLAASGLVVGASVAYVAGRGMEALLAGVRPHDAVTFGAAVAVAGSMTLVGCLRPTLRAVRVDPLSVMRAD